MTATIRKEAVQIAGRSFDVIGDALEPGDNAPGFRLIGTDWRPVTLNDFGDSVKLISVVPSLDTSVCTLQTRRFEHESNSLDERVAVLTISADMPATQARWQEVNGLARIVFLSDYLKMSFAESYGTFVQATRQEQRSVFVLDGENKIVHAEYVPAIDNEPDYEAALTAVRQLLRTDGPIFQEQ